MKLKLGALIAAASVLAVAAYASVESGLKPGDKPGAFQVVDVTGPSKGKQLCYRCQYAAAPVMAAFINGDATKSAKLVADLQKIMDSHKDKGLKSFVVFMSGPEAKDAIQKIAEEKKTTIPLVLLPKGTKEEDIAAYKINASAKNTVLLWKGMTVQSNFVDVDSSKISQIEKAVDTMLK
ncbi:MAG TPA: hypothetical protein VKU00_14840 [Chthonomonadaceae bacterium]|nr:hypothetical protein [Chthonomonadaceae bacterium]